jgi:ADP-heptose:LPS heptosyltransferase
VIKPSSLGDVIHTLPAVAELARACPEASIHWLANGEWAPLLEGNPALAGVISFPRSEFRGYRPSSLRAARQWARENLSSLRPSLALDFQGLLRSALLARASGAERIAGFTRSREGAAMFYDERVDVRHWDRWHAVHRYRRLVSATIGGGGELPEPDPGDELEFALPQGDEIGAGELSEREREILAGDYVVLHPFSRGLLKSLSNSEVVAFCDMLAPTPVVVVGVDRQEFAPGLPKNAVDLLARTSLSQLIRVLRGSCFSVSIDSGPMHLAAAISDRLLGIHSWTNPRVVGPCRLDAWVCRGDFIGQVRDVEAERFPEKRPSFPKGVTAFVGTPRSTLAVRPLLSRGMLEAVAARVAAEISLP